MRNLLILAISVFICRAIAAEPPGQKQMTCTWKPGDQGPVEDDSSDTANAFVSEWQILKSKLSGKGIPRCTAGTTARRGYIDHCTNQIKGYVGRNDLGSQRDVHYNKFIIYSFKIAIGENGLPIKDSSGNPLHERDSAGNEIVVKFEYDNPKSSFLTAGQLQSSEAIVRTFMFSHDFNRVTITGPNDNITKISMTNENERQIKEKFKREYNQEKFILSKVVLDETEPVYTGPRNCELARPKSPQSGSGTSGAPSEK